MKVQDSKGGDFVENPDLTLLVVSQNRAVIAELAKGSKMLMGPEGCYKLIEIGVNNYSPDPFRSQKFAFYFLYDSKNYEQPLKFKHENGKPFEPISDSSFLTEREILVERLQNDTVAFCEFTSQELVENSDCPENFEILDYESVAHSDSRSSRRSSLKGEDG